MKQTLADVQEGTIDASGATGRDATSNARRSAIEIRRAGSADAEDIAALLDESFSEFKDLYTPAAYRSSTPEAAAVRRRLDEGPIWIASLAQTIVGTVSAFSMGDDLFVRSMAVHPSDRGRGTAQLLLDAAERFAAEHRFRRLSLTTTPFLLGAIKLYERAGFRFTGDESTPHGTRLLTMVKDLAPTARR